MGTVYSIGAFFSTDTPRPTATFTITPTSTRTPNHQATLAYLSRQTSVAGVTQTKSALTSCVNIIQFIANSNYQTKFCDPFTTDANDWSLSLTNDDWGKRTYKVGSGKLVWDWTASTGLTTRHTIDSLTVSDFEATLNAQRLRGPEATACYGLVFRENYSGYYVFLVCDDKTYEVAIYNNDSWNVLISWTTSEFIKPGEVNQLTVLGSDESFQLYINGEYIDSFQDNTFRSGHVGIIIQLNEGDSAEFSFDNLAVLSP